MITISGPRFLRSAAALLLVTIACTAASLAQDAPDSSWADPDSAWQDTEEAWRELEGMNPNDIDFQEAIGRISRGWFPQAQPASSLSIFGEVFYADVHDRGSGIRSSALVPTTAAYGWRNPFDGDEREILEANSDDEADESYPATDYTEYGVAYTYNLPMPAVVRLGGSLQITEGMLFAHDTTRSFLSISGVKRPLKEVSVLYLKNYSLTASGGINIPFYGVFVDSELGTLASYYYLYLGASASYVIGSRATQYQQIADPKSEIRYGNGGDTVTLISRRRLEGLDRIRTAIDVALGWTFSAEFFTFSFEAFASIPQSAVLIDTPWKQYYVGLRTSLGYQWLPGR
jgi:hypothetical protein